MKVYHIETKKDYDELMIYFEKKVLNGDEEKIQQN